MDAVAYFLAGGIPAPRIREPGEQEAARGPGALAEAFGAARARLAGQLSAVPSAGR
jgi:hypothetical protein